MPNPPIPQLTDEDVAKMAAIERQVNTLSASIQTVLVGQDSAFALSALMGVVTNVVHGSRSVQFALTTAKYLRDEADNIERLARTPAIIIPGDR